MRDCLLKQVEGVSFEIEKLVATWLDFCWRPLTRFPFEVFESPYTMEGVEPFLKSQSLVIAEDKLYWVVYLVGLHWMISRAYGELSPFEP